MLEQNILCDLCAEKGEVLWYLLKSLLLLLVLHRTSLALRLADCKTVSWLDSMSKHERRASVKVFEIVFSFQVGSLLKTLLLYYCQKSNLMQIA